jgi:asparagine synthase (glutamine-hydrolysing)
MCGIAGWLGLSPEVEGFIPCLLSSLEHRGPDAKGVRTWPNAAVVHTRLSILDLSPAGAQPIGNEDGTVWAIFNGEIYNHRELRHELEIKGHLFRGHSDSEVIPHLYEEEGPSFVSRLKGMFALAIYDSRDNSLLLARDRFGIKPLFYAPGVKRLAFASEISALLKFPDIDDSPDKQAIHDFAALFYIPAPETFYRGIRALQPCEMLRATFDDDRVSWNTVTYHRWAVAPDYSLTLDRAVDEVDLLLNRAVRRQLESDVSIGVLLSGGIDSSLIAAATKGAVGNGIRTYSVSFPEREYDETWAAQDVARHINSQHETLRMGTIPGTWEHLTTLLRHVGQPFADTSLFAVHAVSRLMRDHVTVVLSGDGGDEAFGGYHVYRQIVNISHLDLLPRPFLNGAITGLRNLSRLGIVPKRYPQRLKDLSRLDNTSVVQDLFCWMRQHECDSLFKDKDVLPVTRLFEPQWVHDAPSNVSRLERLSAHCTEINVRLALPNDYLFKVDIASMKEGLEIRVPMLDEDLFSFGLTLPHRFKARGGTCKVVLRKVAERWLPRQVATKPKRGFELPVDTWADGDCKAQIKEALLNKGSSIQDLFRVETYRPYVEAFCQGRQHPASSRHGLSQRIIMLLGLELALGKGHR